MNDILNVLKKSGQILSGDLAKIMKTSERNVNVMLYPHLATGVVMSCQVYDGNGKFLGTEYRYSGVIPQRRPGRPTLSKAMEAR